MRTWVLLLMIVLLPVRVWAAEGLATRMAQPQGPAQAATTAAMDAAMNATMDAAMPADCPMLAAAGEHPEQGAQPASYCVACYVFAAAMRNSPLEGGHAAAPGGPRTGTAAPYTDAELAPDLRPPIA